MDRYKWIDTYIDCIQLIKNVIRKSDGIQLTIRKLSIKMKVKKIQLKSNGKNW